MHLMETPVSYKWQISKCLPYIDSLYLEIFRILTAILSALLVKKKKKDPRRRFTATKFQRQIVSANKMTHKSK